MRDLLVVLLVFGSIPYIFSRPWIGIMMWSWLSYMNPHRLTWGFAYNFPFAQVIGLVTLVAVALSKEKKHFPWTGLTITWMLFVFWLNFTTLFAMFPNEAIPEWDRAMKIQLFAVITVLLINSRERLFALTWVTAMSLGFYGIKGGIFALLTGGNYLVWGPPGSFFEDNNALGLTLVMTMPLMYYLLTQYTNRYVKFALVGALGLTALAVLSTHSRGALLAISAMFIFMWFKSPHKGKLTLVALAFIPVLLQFMPDEWFNRMGTISEYEQDDSAMGRINAWWFAYYLALDHPFVGGGFICFRPSLFLQYAPDPDEFHDAHSIYFEVLGEQGFVGLFLFLLLGVLALRTGTWIIKHAGRFEELRWARDLAAMVQVSLIGYAVGGAFLGLAYFDLYYNFIAMLAALRLLVTRHMAGEQAPASTTGWATKLLPPTDPKEIEEAKTKKGRRKPRRRKPRGARGHGGPRGKLARRTFERRG